MYKLTETYQILFEMQEKLGIGDDYLLNTIKGTPQDVEQSDNLSMLLDLYKKARDNLITWYLKQTLVELNVTISLITAKIKFIEYKLNLCNGIDLHQACSLSLVDFCNILTDLITESSKEKRKKMHDVSDETGLPVWLSHYRNLICHVPSEGPCISILVPLVQQSLNYMKESFWLRIVERESFNEHKFKKLAHYVAKLVHLRCENRRRICLKKDATMSKRHAEHVQSCMTKHQKACTMLRHQISRSPVEAVNVLANYLITKRFGDRTRNNPLLLTQLIYARCFERFVFKLIWIAERYPKDKAVMSWLNIVICLISYPNSEDLAQKLSGLGIHDKALTAHIDIASVKCCRIAYRLMMLEGPECKRLLLRMRHKLLPVLGKKKTLLIMKMTRILGFEREL